MKLALLGDMAFYGSYSLKYNKNLLKNLEGISNYLSKFDCVVGNLETPFSIKKKTNGAKSAYICADIENAQLLKYLHINAVCLANNHMFDYGNEGYECTKKILSDNGISIFGTEGKEYRFETEKNKLLFSGFCCYSSNPLNISSDYGGYGINKYNVDLVGKIIKDRSNKGFLNIVSVHAGIEHVNYPHTDHVRAARQLSEIATYIYYGHHPHVIQGIENMNQGLIAYSLGNFCFDDVYTPASKKPLIKLSENNRRGIILEVTIEDNKIIDWNERSIYIHKDGNIAVLLTQDSLLKEYNESLYSALSSEDYIMKRQTIINKYINDRKSQRDIIWYLKRLRPKYIKLIIDMRNNLKSYRNNVVKYLKN